VGVVRPAARATRPAGVDQAALGALAVVGVAVAVASRHPVSAAGALALGAFAVAAFRSRGTTTPVLGGQLLPLAFGTSFLTLARGGVLDVAWADTMWRPAVAVAAYPFVARALLRMVARTCSIRDGDVVVEAALVGVAAAAVLQLVVADWGVSATSSAIEDARSALPAVLVGLDVALLVVGGRALVSAQARRGPLGLQLASAAALTVAHLLQALQVTGASLAVLPALAAVSLVCLGLAAVHPKAAVEPDLLAAEPRLFSATHAGLVVVALVAAPVVLAVQAIRSISASPTIATGAVVSGLILAGYLVNLLQERAATEHRATHDALTKLPNRTLFADRLERAVAHARRTDRPVAVLFIDLDRFKEVNDTFGHAAGDILLTTVAERLVGCCRDEDTVARLAGDEFALLLPHISTGGDAVVVAQRILDALSEPITLAGQRLLAAASIGIAVHPDDGLTTEELLASADAAMYRAKEHGGNSYELFNADLSTQTHARLRLEAALIEGLEAGQLVLHYQPVVDLRTGRVVGAEALVRWEHPEKGLLMPAHFVPIAERSDLVVLLGVWVIEEACRQLRYWHDLGFGDRYIAVNVSARHFSHGLASDVTAALRATGAAPRNLVVELTESTAADNLEVVAATLAELRDLGVRSAIDDFGTGYSGLRYLASLPVDTLKIDKSFVQGMTPSDAAIVAATVAMGHSLGLNLVAEGVETPEQHRFLIAQGCDRVQGYLFGRPMPAEELVDRLRAEAVQPPTASTSAAGSNGLRTPAAPASSGSSSRCGLAVMTTTLDPATDAAPQTTTPSPSGSPRSVTTTS